MRTQAGYCMIKKRLHHKKPAKGGDIILLLPSSIATSTVIVEAIGDRELFVELDSGSLAILIKRHKNISIVMTAGFIGWVYNDEWIPENI
jgi:hypothetical protein